MLPPFKTIRIFFLKTTKVIISFLAVVIKSKTKLLTKSPHLQYGNEALGYPQLLLQQVS